MPDAAAPPCCLWAGCLLPGPYGDDWALLDHLKAAHNPRSGEFVCQWSGCTHTSTGPQQRVQHLCRHAAHRPYPKRPCSQDFAPAAGSRCKWAGCDATFAGAVALHGHVQRVHIAALLRVRVPSARCGWAHCGYRFRSGKDYSTHVRKRAKVAPPLARPDESESELDIVITVRTAKEETPPRKHLPSTPPPEMAQMSVAQISGASMAVRAAQLRASPPDDEDDWVFCA
ncbi:hypothetical protein AURDEDRAFT_166322 [Auricularia subglabra TFB-10046 SS5]|uniref:C2H2-type domain-containing protein n=1 Tax=Auricularia subglabra (strain TFB-10046 / SS5) TaxID=717982 RepID=J0LKK2_AURST|nr:hypothetical protein AURDEDRAFT_166322 [Auricularia subglabra TFB-10046 SS5]